MSCRSDYQSTHKESGMTLILLQKNLREIANPERALHSQRFFKTGKGEYGEGDLFLGIRVPALRQHAKKHINMPLSDIKSILKSKYHEERLCALMILTLKFSKGTEVEKTEIYNLYIGNTKYINNWDLVDNSAQYIVGAYLENREKKIIYDMAKSQNLWERRIAIISTFHMIRNNSFTDALNISEILNYDREDLIHKAVGWMLREVGKRDIKEEKIFLDKHYKNMPRTMLRYAIERFPERERGNYLKGLI
jgi:3-methyladenine DNA glycosylase AlkD